jgi:phosphatidate cytidylyltransferase
MLDHKGLPNFKITAMICGAVMLCGSFYYFAKFGPARSYDFELAVLLFLLLTVFTRQMFESLREEEPLKTMAYTLFGLLYVLWLYNFITKIVYVTPRAPNGAVTGQFYVLYCIAITKFSDMGAYLTGSLFGRHPLVPHISPKKTWEGFFGALAFSLLASVGLTQDICHPDPDAPACGRSSLPASAARRSRWSAQHRGEGSATCAGNWRRADLVDSLLFTRPLFFISA